LRNKAPEPKRGNKTRRRRERGERRGGNRGVRRRRRKRERRGREEEEREKREEEERARELQAVEWCFRPRARKYKRQCGQRANLRAETSEGAKTWPG